MATMRKLISLTPSGNEDVGLSLHMTVVAEPVAERLKVAGGRLYKPQQPDPGCLRFLRLNNQRH